MTNHTNRLEAAFGKKKVVLPVIHISSEAQALRNVLVAREAGADGVFLIHHGGDTRELLEVTGVTRSEHPDLWIGVNMLGESPLGAWRYLDEKVDGLWVDNAGVDERTETQPYAEAVTEARMRSGWDGLYFGGVAFKYQRPVEDLETAGAKSREYVDVPTTSGAGTGSAADIEKIQRFHQGLGGHPMGIASGISVDNVEEYLPYVDAFLVASAISQDFHNLDPYLTRELVKRVH